MAAESTSGEVERFLEELPQEIRAVATELRERMRELLPGAVERFHGGWKTVGYSLDGTMKTWICAVLPHSKHVNVQFPRGTELDDPAGMLEGTGKKSRHVKVRSPDEARGESLDALVLQARGLVEGGEG